MIGYYVFIKKGDYKDDIMVKKNSFVYNTNFKKMEFRIAFTIGFQLNKKKKRKSTVIARLQYGPQRYCLLVFMPCIITSYIE